MEGTPVRRDAEWQLQAPSTQAAGAPSLYAPNKARCTQSPPLQLPAPRARGRSSPGPQPQSPPGVPPTSRVTLAMCLEGFQKVKRATQA